MVVLKDKIKLCSWTFITQSKFIIEIKSPFCSDKSMSYFYDPCCVGNKSRFMFTVDFSEFSFFATFWRLCYLWLTLHNFCPDISGQVTPSRISLFLESYTRYLDMSDVSIILTPGTEKSYHKPKVVNSLHQVCC